LYLASKFNSGSHVYQWQGICQSKAAMEEARKKILHSFPIPKDLLKDPLRPFSIPAPFTIYEFFGNATGVCSFLPETRPALTLLFQQMTKVA
jgi:hypothetical protein